VEAAAKANNTTITYLSCNVTDPDDVTHKFAQLVANLRHPIRGLVACAGISDNGPAVDFPASAIRRLLDVNVTGTFLVAQAVAKEMTKSSVNGSIVLVASMSGHVSNKASRLYFQGPACRYK
jgi:NAD(P)-dependent dehydrogenase (short-subunit alcohol dehydrogenase family)